MPISRLDRRLQSRSNVQQSQQAKMRNPSGKVKKIIKRKTAPAKDNPKMNRSGSATSNQSSNSTSLTSAGSGSIMALFGAQSGNFTPANLQQFLRANNFSHVIRTEMLSSSSSTVPYRIGQRKKLITLGGIGKQTTSKGAFEKGNLFGSIALANRQKIRLIRLGSLFQQAD